MRYAVLGAGFIAPINAAAVMRCEGAEICCIANRTAENAEKMKAKLGLSCPVHTDYREALDREKPDAAVICVFNDQHREYFTECARRGIHVLCEKPLANTYEDCLALMKEQEESGIRASVLQTQRYGAVLVTAAAYIREHRDTLGKLCGVEDNMSVHYFWDGRSPWHLDPVRSGGGIVMNYGVHQLDRVHHMIRTAAEGISGSAKTVEFHGKALTEKPGIDVYSSYAMFGVTESGIPYTVSCSGYCGPAVNEMMLHFQNATIKCVLSSNGMDERGVYVSEASGFRKIPLLCGDGEGGCDMYARELQAADAWLKGEVPEAPVPLAWAAEMVRLCEKIL